MVRSLVGIAAVLLALQLLLLLLWGRNYVPSSLPWYAITTDTFSMLAAASIAFVAFGRWRVLWDPTPFWIGIAFTGYALFAVFYVLTVPGMLLERGLLSTTAGTASWFWHLQFTVLSIGLLIAPNARWPGRGGWTERHWPWLVAVEAGVSVLAGILFLLNQRYLPALIVGQRVNLLDNAWSFVLVVAFGVGTVFAARRYEESSDSLCAFVALAQLFLAFAILTDIVGTTRYDVWWYWRRVLWIVGFSVMLFGLLAEYVQLFQREQARAHQLEALQRITEALVREIELTGVANVIIERSREVLAVDAVAVWVVEPRPFVLNLVASSGVSESFKETIRHRIPGFVDIAVTPWRLEETHVIEDVGRDDMPPTERERFLREGLRAVVAIPLHVHGRLVGVVGYGTRLPRRFSPSDLAFITTVADLFAVAIENARLYEEVRHALQLREEFMSAAAHELRSPVAVIKGRTQFTLKTDAREPGARRALEEILRTSDRITRLTDDLLAVIRVRPGEVALNREEFDLGALVRTIADRFTRSVTGRQVRVTTTGALWVNADCTLVTEVLNRLLENAVRYAPEGQPIEIDARQLEDRAVVSVTDRRAEIPLDRRANVFEPFYEFVAPGTPGYAGLVSLGLYLSKQIVDAHGGRIWFVSNPTDGTTFSFSLPLVSSVQVRMAG